MVDPRWRSGMESKLFSDNQSFDLVDQLDREFLKCSGSGRSSKRSMSLWNKYKLMLLEK